MTKTFGPKRDALNLEIRSLVDETFSLLEKGRLNESNDSPIHILSKAAPRKASIKTEARNLFGTNGSAFAPWRVRDHAQPYGAKPLRNNELNTVHALLAWVANEQRIALEIVHAITETRFNITDVTHLKQKDYDEVITFLVDVRIEDMCN
jgi:hypothetical protein